MTTPTPTAAPTPGPATAPPPDHEPSTHLPPPARLRASDVEREDVVARLHHALGEGRLDLAEVEPRVAAAYAAQYRDELPPLLADLPPGAAGTPHTPSGAAPSWAELWVQAVWRVRAALLGPVERPTPAQCRTAARVAALAVVWLLLWAFVGAAVVT